MTKEVVCVRVLPCLQRPIAPLSHTMCGAMLTCRTWSFANDNFLRGYLYPSSTPILVGLSALVSASHSWTALASAKDGEGPA